MKESAGPVAVMWPLAAIVMAVGAAAAVEGTRTWIMAALLVAGVFALAGIVLGLWVGRTVGQGLSGLS